MITGVAIHINAFASQQTPDTAHAQRKCDVSTIMHHTGLKDTPQAVIIAASSTDQGCKVVCTGRFRWHDDMARSIRSAAASSVKELGLWVDLSSETSRVLVP